MHFFVIIIDSLRSSELAYKQTTVRAADVVEHRVQS